MDKPIRKAVRCYLIKDNEVVVTKYKKVIKKKDITIYLEAKLRKEKTQSKQQ